MNEYELLTSEQRLQRIAELLSKAVTLYVLKEREAGRKVAAAGVVAKVEAEEDDWITRGMMSYMMRFGWATPQEMLRHLDVTRSTLFRRLRELRKRGLVESRGHTSGTQYRILVGQVV